jgi:hypothetical protein
MRGTYFLESAGGGSGQVTEISKQGMLTNWKPKREG